jgi:hypothetical protein
MIYLLFLKTFRGDPGIKIGCPQDICFIHTGCLLDFQRASICYLENLIRVKLALQY